MIWATGDCHGNFERFRPEYFPEQAQMTKDDVVVVTGDFGGRTLIAACYDAGGRMIQARTLTEARTISLAQNSAAIRLFLLKDGTPVCPAVPVEAPTA